ncbi:unnamed protein product [Oncorhynchus mykiss]|uniref:Reverse transcriptase domain-containing protein n=1 Tax=Oncorhynchus mykiss TaxID=8022 RepID=A0A060W9S5_ONCMY|nr:unnamed protein product [Oncorhynchus mykiss]
MKSRHTSSNIRLALGLIDYSDAIDSDAVVIFLDFCKAFDTIEHEFLFRSLKLFGFGENFIKVICMFYKDINSYVLLNLNISKRFSINRSVRQGCPISQFLFILVVELFLFYLFHLYLTSVQVAMVEIKISQLADDTTLFLRDKDQVAHALNALTAFSIASGLMLNVSKCEILCFFLTLMIKKYKYSCKGLCKKMFRNTSVKKPLCQTTFEFLS